MKYNLIIHQIGIYSYNVFVYATDGESWFNLNNNTWIYFSSENLKSGGKLSIEVPNFNWKTTTKPDLSKGIYIQVFNFFSSFSDNRIEKLFSKQGVEVFCKSIQEKPLESIQAISCRMDLNDKRSYLTMEVYNPEEWLKKIPHWGNISFVKKLKE